MILKKIVLMNALVVLTMFDTGFAMLSAPVPRGIVKRVGRPPLFPSSGQNSLVASPVRPVQLSGNSSPWGSDGLRKRSEQSSMVVSPMVETPQIKLSSPLPPQTIPSSSLLSQPTVSFPFIFSDRSYVDAILGQTDPTSTCPCFKQLLCGSYQSMVQAIESCFYMSGMRDAWGRSMLHQVMLSPCCLTHEQRICLVKRLLDEEENINVQDNDGLTPLHLAVAKGDIQMVQFLLDYEPRVGRLPVNPNIRAHAMQLCPRLTPYTLALALNKPAMIRVFQEWEERLRLSV